MMKGAHNRSTKKNTGCPHTAHRTSPSAARDAIASALCQRFDCRPRLITSHALIPLRMIPRTK
jgi:hypothetical protein